MHPTDFEVEAAHRSESGCTARSTRTCTSSETASCQTGFALSRLDSSRIDRTPRASSSRSRGSTASRRSLHPGATSISGVIARALPGRGLHGIRHRARDPPPRSGTSESVHRAIRATRRGCRRSTRHTVLQTLQKRITVPEWELAADRRAIELCLEVGYDGVKCLRVFRVSSSSSRSTTATWGWCSGSIPPRSESCHPRRAS